MHPTFEPKTANLENERVAVYVFLPLTYQVQQQWRVHLELWVQQEYLVVLLVQIILYAHLGQLPWWPEKCQLS